MVAVKVVSVLKTLLEKVSSLATVKVNSSFCPETSESWKISIN